MSPSSARFIQVPAQALRKSFRPRLLLLSAALCGLAMAVPAIRSQASSSALQQGVDTIRQILAKDGLYSRATATASNNYKATTERTYALSEANGCKLIVQSDTHIHTELPEKKSVIDRKSSEFFRPDFSEMDASTIYVGDPEPPQPTWQMKGYLVRINLEVGKPLMVASSVDKASNAARDLPGLPTLAVYVSSREAADKLAAAFKQVATACHANPSAK